MNAPKAKTLMSASELLAPKHDPARSFELTLAPEDWQQVLQHLRKSPWLVMHDRRLRKYFARKRAEHFQQNRQFKGDRSNMIDIAIAYNELNSTLESHVLRLVRPLSILDPVYERAVELDVLSIGPRAETELFLLYAHNFHGDRIKAIDLIAHSPLIDVADMHEIPYPANRFDVVISAWTLPYSKNPSLALAEKVRVLRDGGLMCIGLTRVVPGSEDDEQLKRQGSANYESSQQILDDIGAENIAAVAFRQDPLDRDRKGAILLIVRVRK